jgi:hypothetical protein
MRRGLLLHLTGLVASSFLSSAAKADSVTTTDSAPSILKCVPSQEPSARGFCSVIHSVQPEGWIRASADLDKTSGKVILAVQLETDSVLSGPRGTVAVSFYDARGVQRASAALNRDVSRKGKSCGQADPCGITTFTSTLSIPLAAARDIATMAFSLEQHGEESGIDPDIRALAIEVTSVATLKRTVASLDRNLAPGTITITTSPEAAPLSADPRVTLDQDSRIAGGKAVPLGAYPWMAALFRPQNDRFVQSCGGTLIRPSWILTAAHCQVAKTWLVVLGRTDLSNPHAGEVRHVAEVFIPTDQYDAKTKNADIALLQLDKPSTIFPISLAHKSLTATTRSLLVTGWGATVEQGNTTVVMRQVDVAPIAPGVCSSCYPGKLTSTMMCAGLPTGGKDSCQGDSGGPIFGPDAATDPTAAFRQYGVVSWGEGCARANRPGVYTDVVAMKRWIEQTLSRTSRQARR